MPVNRPDGAAAQRLHGRWAAWIVALCVLALLAQVALHVCGPQLQDGERALVSRAQSLPALFGGDSGDGSGDSANGQHQYWQVGVTGGPDATNATGMRTTIATRLPETLAERTTDYFWVGSYLADGSFIQVGYYVPWYDHTHAGWFYCAFTSDQKKGPCVYGPAGSAGKDGDTHTYTLQVKQPTPEQVAPAPQPAPQPSPPATTQDPPSATIHGPERSAESEPAVAFTWEALVDGTPVGHFDWTSGTTGTNAPGIFAENSGFSPHAPASTLGPVEFPGGLQTRAAGQDSYTSPEHVRPIYDGTDICPPYGVHADDDGDVLLGSGLACPSDDTWLW